MHVSVKILLSFRVRISRITLHLRSIRVILILPSLLCEGTGNEGYLPFKHSVLNHTFHDRMLSEAP
jgi:hypothetical protein